MIKYTPTDEYFELLRQFPLTLIRTRDQHKQAMSTLQMLATKPAMKQGESDYFDVLAKLVRDYENETIERIAVLPQQALTFIMEQRKLSQLDLAELTGLQPSHICEFLTGKRNLPSHAASTLGATFKVDPMIFLPRITILKTAPASKRMARKVPRSSSTTLAPSKSGKAKSRTSGKIKSKPTKTAEAKRK